MKFDQKYIDFLKANSEEFAKEGFDPFTTIFASYIDWAEGNVSCGCDHGCNQASLENTSKLIALIRAQKDGASPEKLDELALEDPKEHTSRYILQLWDKAFKRADKREAKN
jgi:hypothetical protein